VARRFKSPKNLIPPSILSGRGAEGVAELNATAIRKMAWLSNLLVGGNKADLGLEMCLVRLAYCFFANCNGVFPSGFFTRYLESSNNDGDNIAERLADLREYILAVNPKGKKSGLFAGERLSSEIPHRELFAADYSTVVFDGLARKTLLECARLDWNKVSPAIFGTIYQGAMDQGQRKRTGAHYTSEENIFKLIKPLFLDELWRKYESIKDDLKALANFRDDIGKLKFFDPACGCGSFLIVAYRELRLLEKEIVKNLAADDKDGKQGVKGGRKVTAAQFYGVDIEAFPCLVAKIGLWLMDRQLISRRAEKLEINVNEGQSSPTIIQANALTLDWEKVVKKTELSYILGNPPFSGARTMTKAQKQDMALVFNGHKRAMDLDYVAAWHLKAADMAEGTNIRAAFVATSSVAKGSQPTIIWRPLFARGVHINFVEPPFQWNSDSRGKALVTCVIIGFSYKKTKPFINQYLQKAPAIFIESRSKPISDVPEIGVGNVPIDGGHYLFGEKEKLEFIKKEPKAAKWFRPFLGASEFLNGKRRYCLYLKNVPYEEINQTPLVALRVEAVRKFRLASGRLFTRVMAEKPTEFSGENIPQSAYVAIPKVTTVNRPYLPIAFLPPKILASDLLFILPSASWYHFGVLSSLVHMAWVKAVSGRLGLAYRYSKDIVYNNFPWPKADASAQDLVGELAKEVINARTLFPGLTLAELYGEEKAPEPLLKAHEALDEAVIQLYKFKKGHLTEPEMVNQLFELNFNMTAKK
jgi:hypothetical protein